MLFTIILTDHKNYLKMCLILKYKSQLYNLPSKIGASFKGQLINGKHSSASLKGAPSIACILAQVILPSHADTVVGTTDSFTLSYFLS